ncbi:MAG TPA: Smr/MutS family protein [bacterium]|nr:Smr/MutS family protein [bacterium]
MIEKAKQRLEFDRIVDRLRGLCGSTRGKEFASSISVSANAADVREELGLTSQCRMFAQEKGGTWDFWSVPDMDLPMRKLSRGEILDPLEIHCFRKVLEFAGSVKGEKIDPVKYPDINECREGLFAGTSVARRIAASVDEMGNVLDGASPALARARRRMRDLEKTIPDRLRSIMNSSKMSVVIQDAVVTTRNDRFVMPIKSEHLSRGQWALQDRSSSGATLFVEPLELISENNELTKERLAVKAEVSKVLRELTSALAEKFTEIDESLEALGELDYLLARGRLSAEMRGIEPAIADGDAARIRGGRHPLLGDNALPVDVEIGGDIRALVLTGPNAGGKSVTMKMLGLFQLMAQAGLHIPADEGSSLPIYEKVFAVIGDEQSVEKNLSTFSSHLKEIKETLENAGPGSLVLIDEICSGTDPEEGSALACGILKELMTRGAVSLATSHQSGLKTFATATSGAENARMVFDERAGAPAFRVEIGAPGKSYAMEIARRAGLKEDVLTSAQGYLSNQARMAERLLAELEEMKSFLGMERESMRAERLRLESEKAEHAAKLDQERGAAEERMRKAYEEAEKAVEETRKKCREILKEASEAKGLPGVARVKGELTEIKRIVTEKKPAPVPRERPVTPESLSPEKWYRLIDSGSPVRYLEGPDKRGRVKVMLGDFRMSVDLANLSEAGDIPRRASSIAPDDYATHIINAKGRARNEIDIRGMRAAEAIESLENEISSLNMAGAAEARIIHGIGTGALMKAVHEHLAINPFVKRFEFCESRQGGMGATNIYLAD